MDGKGVSGLPIGSDLSHHERGNGECKNQSVHFLYESSSLSTSDARKCVLQTILGLSFRENLISSYDLSLYDIPNFW
jgi:hypothetical protein